MGPSIVAGIRYVRNAPGVRRIVVRAGLFVIPASALWALLAVTAHSVLRQQSGAYGLMLGALGVGAVIGALALPALRGHLSANTLITLATLVYGIGMIGVALVRSLPVVLAVLLVSGVGWVVVLSILNTAMMLTLPAWVRARSLAVYSMIFMGGQGVGGVVWGAVASVAGPSATLVLAAAITVFGLATMTVWPLYASTGELDREVVPLAESVPDDAIPATAGPVLIQIEYVVTEGNQLAFQTALRALATSRRRTGATAWEAWRDVVDRTLFVEEYTLHSWGEHLAQREERMTGYDRELESRAWRLAETTPTVRHLVRPQAIPSKDRGIAVADLIKQGR
jgi:MFS family permease